SADNGLYGLNARVGKDCNEAGQGTPRVTTAQDGPTPGRVFAGGLARKTDSRSACVALPFSLHPLSHWVRLLRVWVWWLQFRRGWLWHSPTIGGHLPTAVH